MPDETPSAPDNTRRSAIQHAADALWPASEELTRPIRKSFAIPQARALGV